MAFTAIVEEGSFAKAGARLGLSGSALSHTLRGLEERLSVKLLNRTTRSLAPTEAGERVFKRLQSALADIDDALDALSEYRESPRGRVRICTHRMAAMNQIIPKLETLAAHYPHVVVELAVEDGLSDIVSAGFDLGVRPGEFVAKDMVAVRIGPPILPAIVATPAYFARHPIPQSPADLAAHKCIAYRHKSTGTLYRWEFEKDRRPVSVAVEPSFITNDADMMVRAVLKGIGIAFVLEDQVKEELASGALVRVLEDWGKPFAGNFLYYPSQRHVSPALRAVIDTFKYNE